MKLLSVEDHVQLPGVPATDRLSYGANVEQFCDLYLPQKGTLHPVVVLIHGGCWRAQYGQAQLGKAFSINPSSTVPPSVDRARIYRKSGSGQACAWSARESRF